MKPAAALASSKLVRPGAALLLTSLGVAHLLYHASYTLDDAYIGFRYSRNLARGMGLVYNPGDYVKGYSNTLYTLVMALPELFGIDPIGVAKGIGVLSFCALCWLAHRLYADDPDPATRDRGLWLVAWFALSAALALHYIGGLETGLHTTLVFAAVVTRLREQQTGGRPWSALLFAAVALGRPEGIVLFGAMAVHDAGFRLATRKLGARELVWYLVPPLAYAGELWLSTAYYGDPFPQTYYAKAGATHGIAEGLRVLWDGLHSQLQAHSYLSGGLAGTGLGYAGLGLGSLALLRRDRRRQSLAFWLVLLAEGVFVIRAAGDWAPLFRFGVPALPLLFGLVTEAIATMAWLGGRLRRALGWVLAVTVIGIALPKNVADARTEQARKYVDGTRLRDQGTWLAALAEPGVTLASYDIGGHGYAAGGFDILDAKGLTVRETAKCRDQRLPQCIRYAALALPEIVRRHPSKHKDAFVADTVRAQAPYLALASGWYLLQRSLVLFDRAPEWTVSQPELQMVGGLLLSAHDLPPAVRQGQQTSATLYWRRDATIAPAMIVRKLEWRGPGGRTSAHESDVLWQAVGSTDAWQPSEVFADYAVLRAPDAPGRYELRAITADGQAWAVGSVDVVPKAGAPRRALALIATARTKQRSGDELGALRSLGRAVELDPSATPRHAYYAAVVARAKRLRREATALESSDELHALRTLQEAKVLLHRAYWQGIRATSELRAEIDANAAMRSRIIDRDLARQPKGTRTRRSRRRRG